MAIKKVTVKKVFTATENKDGVPYTYKKGKYEGKNFVRISIQTEETGDEYYASNALIGSKPTTIKEGDKLLLNFTEQVVGDKTFKNFDFPTKEQLAEFAASIA
jgi:hypothetical protein